MPKDLKASQLRTGQLIATGSSSTVPLVIVGTDVTNGTGTVTAGTLSGAGTDVFLFVSGAVSGRGLATNGITAFGGDLLVSGTIYDASGNPYSTTAATLSSYFSSTTGGAIFTTGSAAFRGNESSVDAPSDKGSDIVFYVSGSKGTVTTKGSNLALFGGDVATSGSSVYVSPSGFGLVTLSSTDLLVRNRVLGGTFVASVNTSAGNTVNFLDVRPNGAAVNTKIAFMPGIYAGPTSPFSTTDTNFFVGGSAGSKGGSTGGTSVFGGDLFISGSTYVGNSAANTVYFAARLGSDIIPDGNRTRNLGSDTERFANIFTGDLHLKNERGDWTIVEEPDFLCVVNNLTGQKFKMMLQPL